MSGLHVEPEPPARLAADTAIAIVAAIVAVLGLVRFEVEGRTFDLFLAAGFAVVAASTLVFDLKPLVLGEVPSPAEVWASLFADVAAAALIVLAAFLASRLANRRRAVVLAGGGVAAIVALAWAWARRPQRLRLAGRPRRSPRRRAGPRLRGAGAAEPGRRGGVRPPLSPAWAANSTGGLRSR